MKVEKSQWKRFCTWLQAHEQYVPDPAPLVPVLEAVQPAHSHLPKGTLKAVLALKEKRERTKGRIALLERDWTAKLITDRQSFDSFLQTVTRWRKKAVTTATLESFHARIARVLGYRAWEQKIGIEALAITDLLDRTLLQAYVESNQKRGMSSNTIRNDLAVVIPIAQWQFHLSKPDENYSNPEPVKELRSYLKTILIDYGIVHSFPMRLVPREP
ncbi:MAG: hypothetical protein ACAF41_00250 (plasmid) [Leptolyngbya sp. BL-A-14]